MALIGSDYRILRVNSSFAVMLGYTEAELAALPLEDLIYVDGDLSDESLPDGAWSGGLPGGQDTLHLDRRFQRRDGTLLWVHLSLSVVRDSLGRPVYLVAMAEDITERKREEAERDRHTRELQALASTDPLTGVYNHRFMQECLHRRVGEARQTERPISVLMLDLDHFRELNEEYGHDVGDRALRRVAETMRRALRPNDVACRYGGEEFVMILANAEFPSALAVAERIRRGVEGSELVAVGARSVTCSIGVATFPTHASTPTSLLKAADLALYQAKRSGRNRVCGYQPTPIDSPADHLDSLRVGLRDATPEAVSALMTAIDLRDRYTGEHCQRVTRLALDLAALLDCSHGEREILRLGAPLLDVGKIGLPDQILTKPGKLTVEDWKLMRQHPLWGEQLVLSSALPPRVASLVRWHHERLDGSGYPDGLEGTQVPLIVRIAGVADVAEALLGDRPYRRAWTQERVLEFLDRHAGTSLDAEVVEAYRELNAAA
jgi:diguanylate cyclase (GGDEF)-like protein/PAS domain S-box-containing protein